MQDMAFEGEAEIYWASQDELAVMEKVQCL